MRIHRTLLVFAFLATLAAVTVSAAKLPEKLRILSCDVATLTIEASSTATNGVSEELRRLLDKADPDIVFLQHVTDWETCERISKLRPGLRVLTCSAFAAQPGAANAAQVAVLARDKAILSWVDETSAGNGFAFGILQAGPRKLGVFSVQSRDNFGAAAATERVLAEVKKLQQFANNRPEAFLVAGSALTKAALVEAGFETVASDAPAKTKTPAPEFWTSNAGFLSRPRALSAAGIPLPIIVTDVDTANTFSSKFAYQTPLLFPGEAPAPVQAVLQPSATPQRQFPIALIVGGAVVTLFLLSLIFRRRKNTMALVPLGESTLAPADGELSEPVRQNLVAWLKTIFMQRLIADRRQMIADETEATRRTLAIEEKLGHLQNSLQERIAAYECRIARLETELSASTFENRALIRSQIDLLKEKVSKAKEEFVYRRN